MSSTGRPTGERPPVISAAASPSGANERYVSDVNPPNDCPSTVHGLEPSSARIASQSRTMASARNWVR